MAQVSQSVVGHFRVTRLSGHAADPALVTMIVLRLVSNSGMISSMLWSWGSLQERPWVAPKEFSGEWSSLECLIRAFASRELDNSFARTGPKAEPFVSRERLAGQF